MAAQQFQFRFVQETDAVDYIPSADTPAGAPALRGSLFGITKRSILANQLGATATRGVYDGVKKALAFTDGQALYWDADGDPVGGTAGTGALTNVAADGIFCGFAIGAVGSGVAVARFMLWQKSVVVA